MTNVGHILIQSQAWMSQLQTHLKLILKKMKAGFKSGYFVTLKKPEIPPVLENPVNTSHPAFT